MYRNFEFRGDWFLPSLPSLRIPGILKYDSSEGATLELLGLLPINDIDIDIVNGFTTDSKEITLHRIFLHHRGGMTLVQNGETGSTHSIYTVNYIFIGHHFEKTDDIQFNNVIAQIFNFDEWVGISGFRQIKINPRKVEKMEFDIKYRLPAPIEFGITPDLNGMFNFVGILPPRRLYQSHASIRQKVELRLMSEKMLTLKDTLENLFIFQNFIALSVYQALYPKEIILTSKKIIKSTDNKSTPILKKIELHFAIRANKSKGQTKDMPEMLFSYLKIQKKFSTLISKWYQLRFTLEPVYNLLFEQFYTTGPVTENNFLNMAQAAEAMHAKLHKGTKMSPKKYEKMKEHILEVTNPKYHSWLNDQFNYGNGLSLHQRLQQLITKYDNAIISQIIGKTIEEKEKFIKKVKDSRNYYTHYSSNGKKKALKSVELFYLSQKLKAIVVAGYLQETGFSHGEVAKMMENQKRYFIPFSL